MSVFLDNPVQPIVAMPTDLDKWQRHAASITDPGARWRIYLHDIGLSALMQWLQEEFEQPVWPWPHAAPYDMWHSVAGLCLQLGDKKLTVILSETIAMDEIEVPREWVDLSTWQADYYLAAHVNVDDQQLILWGYTTLQQLKAKGTYTPATQTYRLQADDMVKDFAAFWVAHQKAQRGESPTNSSTVSLPTLSTAAAETLLQQLIDAPDPRLTLPFSDWAALFFDPHWRQRLYQQQTLVPVSIRDWFDQIYTQGWQPGEALLGTDHFLSLRAVTTHTAILTCGKKIILDDDAYDDLLLMFSVDMEEDNSRHIRIQLYSSTEPVLPKGVVLSLNVPQTNQRIKSVISGDKDTFIQIPPFRCPAGQHLRVDIQLASLHHQEEFVS